MITIVWKGIYMPEATPLYGIYMPEEATPQMFKSMFRLGSRATPTGSDLTPSKISLSLTLYLYYTTTVSVCQGFIQNK